MVNSFYYWEGLLKREHESLLLVKTLASRRGAVMDYLRQNHGYDLPEILEVAIDDGAPRYLEWLAGQVANRGPDVK